MENRDSSWNILFVDDDEDDYILTRQMLFDIKKQAIHLEWAQNYQEAFQKLSSQANWDVVLVDYDLKSDNGIHLIREAVSNGVEAPFVMVTGRGRYEVDVEAMQAGAYDYLTKSELSPALLERVIRYAKERQRIEDVLELRVAERTEELQVALEELQVMEEELRTQLEEILKSQENRDESYERYKDLFEFAPSVYLVTDPFGMILEANSAATALFDGEKEAFVGKPLSLFFAEGDKPAFRSSLSQLSQAHRVREWDLRIQTLQKETVEVHAVASPVRGVDGKVITIRWLLYGKKDSRKTPPDLPE